MNKKESELYYLERFLELLALHPTKIQSKESPDFIITLNNNMIGVELTDFHSNLKGVDDKPRRVIEETWGLLQKTIMEEVRKHQELKETHGILMFRNLKVPTKNLHKKFTEEIIQLSLDMISSDLKEIEPGEECHLLNKYLKKFILKKVHCYITWGWNNDFSWIGTSEEEIISVIQPKIEKVVNYKKENIDELWLIVISGAYLSQATEPFLSDKLICYNKLNNLLEQSGYAKVYLYQYMLNVICEWPNWIRHGKENFIR